MCSLNTPPLRTLPISSSLVLHRPLGSLDLRNLQGVVSSTGLPDGDRWGGRGRDGPLGTSFVTHPYSRYHLSFLVVNLDSQLTRGVRLRELSSRFLTKGTDGLLFSPRNIHVCTFKERRKDWGEFKTVNEEKPVIPNRSVLQCIPVHYTIEDGIKKKRKSYVINIRSINKLFPYPTSIVGVYNLSSRNIVLEMENGTRLLVVVVVVLLFYNYKVTPRV